MKKQTLTSIAIRAVLTAGGMNKIDQHYAIKEIVKVLKARRRMSRKKGGI